MSNSATRVGAEPGSYVGADVLALAQLAFAESAPAATVVAGVPAAFAASAADALDLDLSDPEQCRFGDYTLRAKLGQGGMGVVYRAHQRSLDREVAIKLLAAGPWASPGFIERFRQEAQSAARMQHPNIVTIHEIGEQDGLPFFSMRLVRGQSLAEQLARQGPLPAARAARLIRTVAEAVEYAHRLDVLHLDLKPGNVLIDEHGEPMVADFGLARRLEETLAGEVEEVSGTPSYMAPEQAIAGGRIGVATDVYALGATLFEALTGRPPFRGATARETLEQVVYGAAPSPRSFERSIPLDLQAICMRCLAKEPGERYSSAGALAEDLAEFAKGREVKARPLRRSQRLWRLVRREPRLSALVVLFVSSLLVGLLATTAQWNRADANATDARTSLWSERAQAAEAALADGNGFQGLPALVSNLTEMEASGRHEAAALERQRIGTLLANAPQLIDRIPLETGLVISSVALAPDGEHFAIATHAGNGARTVRHYEIASGRQLWSTATDGLTHGLVFANGLPHGQLRYTPDGNRILVGMLAQPVFASPVIGDTIAMDVADGRVMRPPQLGPGFSDIGFSDDARRAIVRMRSDPTLRFADRFQFYEVDGWRAVGPEHSEVVSMWLYTPDSEWLLRTTDFVHFELVAFGTLARRWTLDLPAEAPIRAWRFSPDGSTLVLGALDGTVYRVDVASGRHSTLPSAPTDAVRWLEFDERGATLAAFSETGQLNAWDLGSGRPRSLPIHAPESVRQGRVRVSGDLLAATFGNAIVIWQLPPMAPFDNQALMMPARVLSRRPFMANAFDLDAGRRLLISGGIEGAIGIWRLPPTAVLAAGAAPLAPQTQYFDGQRIVAVAAAEVRLLDGISGGARSPVMRHPEPVGFAELSADGRWLVTIAGRTLRVIDPVSGQLNNAPIVLPETPLRVALAAAAPLLVLTTGAHATDGFGERGLAINLETAEVRSVPNLPLGMLGIFQLDPRGQFLLTAAIPAKTVEVIDLSGQGRACAALQPENANSVSDLAISADGRSAWMHLSLLERRAAVLKWDMATCTARTLVETMSTGMMPSLRAHGDTVVVQRLAANALAVLDDRGWRARVEALPAPRTTTEFAVSADGRRAAQSTLNAVQLFDLQRGERLSALLPAALAGNDGIARLAFSADGTQLLGRSILGRWLLWQLPTSTANSAELEQLTLVLDPAAAGRELKPAEIDVLRARLRASTEAAKETQPESVVDFAAAPGAGHDPRFLTLDLAAAYNVGIDGQWQQGAAMGGDVVTLAHGVNRLGGIDWRIGGGVQLSGGGPAVTIHPEQPESARVPVADVRVRRVHVLMLLHIPMRRGVAPRLAGQVLLTHTDGSSSALDILSVRDVVTHWQPDLAAPSARSAWAGTMPTDIRNGHSIPALLASRIYAVSLDLPADAAPVRDLRLRVGDGPMEAPLFYAVTLEVDAGDRRSP